MSYHDLSSCTLDDDERRDEANRIIQMLPPEAAEKYSPVERKFIVSIAERHRYVSVKQLFWLRDIKDRYL